VAERPLLCPGCKVAIGITVDGDHIHITHPLPWQRSSLACSTIRYFRFWPPDQVADAMRQWALARHDECGP